MPDESINASLIEIDDDVGIFVNVGGFTRHKGLMPLKPTYLLASQE